MNKMFKVIVLMSLMFMSYQNCAKQKFVSADVDTAIETKSDSDIPEVPVDVSEEVVVATPVAEPPVAQPPVAQPPVAQPPAVPTGKFYCLPRKGQGKTVVEDLYEKFSDGSFSFKEKCSDWHSTVKENHGFNCGTLAPKGINTGSASCCPVGFVTVNGRCAPEVGLGDVCYADANCKAGLYCREGAGNSGRTCQPKK